MKNLILSFVLVLVSFVGFSQKSKLDSLGKLLNNSTLLITKPSPEYVVEFKIDSILYPDYFIDTLENRYNLDLSFFYIDLSRGFSDIVVELGSKQTDGDTYWVGPISLSVIENLHRQGILTNTVNEYVKIEKEKVVAYSNPFN